MDTSLQSLLDGSVDEASPALSPVRTCKMDIPHRLPEDRQGLLRSLARAEHDPDTFCIRVIGPIMPDLEKVSVAHREWERGSHKSFDVKLRIDFFERGDRLLGILIREQLLILPISQAETNHPGVSRWRTPR